MSIPSAGRMRRWGRRQRAPRRVAGITLAELLVFIILVSVGITGILLTLNITAQKSADPGVRKQLLAIAESLLEEVELMPFTYCDPADANVLSAANAAGCASIAEGTTPQPATETRTNPGNPFDNVGDYGGFSLTGITDISGAPVGGLGSYSVAVAVAPVALGSISAASGDALRIQVTATGPDGQSITLEGYRARYAPRSP